MITFFVAAAKGKKRKHDSGNEVRLVKTQRSLDFVLQLYIDKITKCLCIPVRSLLRFYFTMHKMADVLLCIYTQIQTGSSYYTRIQTGSIFQVF